MNVEIQGTAEALDQRDRARVCDPPGITGLMDQVRCNDAVDNAQHASHDRRLGAGPNFILDHRKSPTAKGKMLISLYDSRSTVDSKPPALRPGYCGVHPSVPGPRS